MNPPTPLWKYTVFQCTVVFLLHGVTVARAADAPPPVPLVRFPAPDRVRYDGHCMIIDGRDAFIFSGAFHYFRCPKELWRDRFAKIKAAGFNAVETYAAWNWSERREPKSLSDYSQMDLSDFQEWLRMAHDEFGLYTIIRPGPYICAEWTGGGLPRWLANKKDPAVKGHWLRTDDPTYLAWSKHWFDAVCRVVAPEQITHKPVGSVGTILLQIENEYDLYPASIATDAMREGQLKALYKMVREDGIDVPIFTCWTRQARGSRDPILSQLFDASNFYPRWKIDEAYRGIIDQKKSHPDAPGMVSELQGGWFAGVGDKLAEDQDGVTAQQCGAITLDCIDAGATILNYYMLFGGTNFGDWPARNITTTYDYAAPIRECGGGDEKYRYVWGIGHMLQKLGPMIARSEQIDAKSDNPAIEVGARRTPSGDLLLFFHNPDHEHAAKGTANITVSGSEAIALPFDLEPFGSRMMEFPSGVSDPAKAQLYPQLPPALDRPPVPQPIRIATALSNVDPDGHGWIPFEPGRPKTAYGDNDSYFAAYRTKITLTSGQIARYSMLRLERFEDDPIILQVNGKTVAGGSGSTADVSYDLKNRLQPGKNTLLLLYNDLGQPNFGGNLEDVAGLNDGALIDPASLGHPIENWRVKLVSDAQKPVEVAPDFDDSSWDSFVLDTQTIAALQGQQADKPGPARILYGRQATAVFRTSLELSDGQLQSGETKLTFDCLDDLADVYVNGILVGHSTDWSHPWTFDAAKALKPRKNSIAVVVTNFDGAGGITKAVRLTGNRQDQLPLMWEFAAKTSGEAAHWWKPGFDTSRWQKTQLDTNRQLPSKGSDAPEGETDSLLKWYRTEFELPPVDSHAWVPWKANIDAAGCGFLYLNGHPLGRYFDVGPQREYFLPECWLHFGPGEKNVLAMSLCPAANGVALRAVEIAPYAQYAEKR